MDFAKLLFALEIRDLAFNMMRADHPEIARGTEVPDYFHTYVTAALREATSTAAFIDQELSK